MKENETTDKLFLHIPKTGGISVTQAIEDSGSATKLGRRHFTPEYDKVIRDMHDNGVVLLAIKDDLDERAYHFPVSKIRKEVLEQGTLFSIVRNPWQRLHSQWRFANNFWDGLVEGHNPVLEKMGREQGFDPKALGLLLPDKWEDWSFETFWNWRYYQPEPMIFAHAVLSFYPQAEYLRLEDGSVGGVQVDFNNLEQGLTKVLDTDIVLPKLNVTETRRDIRQDFTDKLIQEVADFYKADIDHWGFDFDTGATKNVVY